MYTANDAIDIWIVERALGQGGMGSVYRCHNRDARRILAAIKVLDYGLKRSPKARARFVREAEILFSLDHPNIVKVRNVRLDADPPYLEMEFVEGGSLERRIADGPVDAPSTLRWLRQLASALSYLHGRGIRHRDIKPSNILVNARGDATLVDFGIATEADGSTLSESGQAMGSVAYVPPEWVHVGALDPVKWDLYALGVCAYEALTGLTAFGVPSGGMSTQRFYQVLTAKQGHAPLDPGLDVPFALRELVRDMTNADPEARIVSAAAVLARAEQVDLADIRPDYTFPDSRGGEPPKRGAAETPRGGTMVPDEPFRPSNATTPPDAFASRPFVRPTAAGFSPGAGTLAPLPEDPEPVGGAPAGPPTASTVERRNSRAQASGGPAPVRPTPRSESAGRGSSGALRWIGGALAVGVLIAGAWALGRAGGGGVEAPKSAPAPALVAPLPPPASSPAPPSEPVPVAVPAVADVHPTAPTSPARPVDAAKKPTESPASVPASPAPDAAVVSAPGKAGPAITNAQLASWLAKHPDWQHDAVLAANKADDKYLRGWEGLTPPAGKEGAPAVAVTWGLASAYCSGHGGLAAVDAEPLKWSEGAVQPWMEYRQEAGKPRWRRDDGVVSPQVELTQSGVFIGFRCAR